MTGPVTLRLAALLVLLLAPMALAAPARAEWRLCNETSFVVEAAAGFEESGKKIVEGWTRLRPGECQPVKRGALATGRYYLYARSSDAHRGGLREWSGREPLCVDAADFSLAGVADCEDVGFETRLFQEVAVAKPEWKTTLEQPHDPTLNHDLEDAKIEGLQRLLQDNGYAISSIDGYAGRQTEREVRRFLADENVTERPDEWEMIDMLEAAALRKADEAGLKVCNRSGADIWTAVALRKQDDWESRGWWPLEPEECARMLDTPVDDPGVYVYAALREEGVDRPLQAATESFCVAETRFAIIGRADCERRGYATGRFSPVVSQGRDSVTLDFTSDDFAPPARGLRR